MCKVFWNKIKILKGALIHCDTDLEMTNLKSQLAEVTKANLAVAKLEEKVNKVSELGRIKFIVGETNGDFGGEECDKGSDWSCGFIEQGQPADKTNIILKDCSFVRTKTKENNVFKFKVDEKWKGWDSKVVPVSRTVERSQACC